MEEPPRPALLLLIRIPRAVADAYSTALLFLGAAAHGPRVPPAAAARNLAFLRRYAGVEMPRRAAGGAAIDEGRVGSGDLLGVVRLDGLDPLIMWGTGPRPAHAFARARTHAHARTCARTREHTYRHTRRHAGTHLHAHILEAQTCAHARTGEGGRAGGQGRTWGTRRWRCG